MVVASIIWIAAPTAYAGVLTARLIFGYGFGSTYLAAIIYGSEISSPKVRAHFIFLLHFFLTLGMFLYGCGIVLTIQYKAQIEIMGSLSIALIIIAAVVGFFTLKASHIFLLQINSKDALERLQYFQSESVDNPQVEILEMQHYVDEEKRRSFDFFGRHVVSAVLLILLAEIGYLSIFNDYHHFYRILYLTDFFSTDTKNFSLMVMMGSRLLGSIIGFILLDRVNKKLQYFIPALIITLGLFTFGVLLQAYNGLYRLTPVLFFIPLELLVGIGLGPMADILRSEIFPLKEKPFAIAETIVFGQLLHITFIAILVPTDFLEWLINLAFNGPPKSIPFVFGSITLVCSIAVFLLLKNTRRQSLRIVSNLYSAK